MPALKHQYNDVLEKE